MELGILKTSEFRDGKHVTVEVPYCTPKKSTLLTGVKGCGKSTALLKFALEDIYAGESVVVIDPRGEVVAELLDHIPAARQPDVIFINPAEQEFALNIFHGVRNKPLFTSTVLDTLRGLWGFEEASTPDFDQYVRYGIRTLLEVPNTNLLSLWLLLTDEEYRDGVLKTIKDPVLKNFWQNFEPLPPKDKRQETKSTLNKLSSFTLDPLVRNCLGQQKNHLVFENKIVLLSLSDAELGEDNARLMGALVLALLYLEGVQRTKTTLYIDGAESFMTPILGKILKGARNIPAILAVQQLDQLKHFKKDWGPSILGAVGQVISFRTSMKDAETLNPLFLLNGKQGPPELYNLDREEFKAWVAVDGQRQDLYTTPHQYSRTNQARKIKARCKSQYTQPRATIEKKNKGDVSVKVDIKRTEEMKGMMSKKKVYVVTVQVKLSEEERKVIELTDALGDCIAIRTPIGKQPDENNQEPLRVSFISGGHPNSYDFANLRQANDYMDELVNGLEALKNFIVHHAGHSAEISREL